MANSVELDLTPSSVASDLGLDDDLMFCIPFKIV